MAKKTNIIKLINTANFGDWAGFLDELQQAPDRSTAILGGVFIDEHLRLLLTRLFIEDEKVVDSLFEVEGALSTFSARTKIAYALGLIGKLTYDDINSIREIRNAFAHTVHGLDFNHKNIESLCKKLQTPSENLPPGGQFTSPRTIYIATIVFIASYLQMKIPVATEQRRHSPGDHFGADWPSHSDVDDTEWTDSFCVLRSHFLIPIVLTTIKTPLMLATIRTPPVPAPAAAARSLPRKSGVSTRWRPGRRRSTCSDMFGLRLAL